MIYSIKIEQRALLYIKQVLAQRPFSEVAPILAGLDAQQAAQDLESAIPTALLATFDLSGRHG